MSIKNSVSFVLCFLYPNIMNIKIYRAALEYIICVSMVLIFCNFKLLLTKNKNLCFII